MKTRVLVFLLIVLLLLLAVGVVLASTPGRAPGVPHFPPERPRMNSETTPGREATPDLWPQAVEVDAPADFCPDAPFKALDSSLDSGTFFISDATVEATDPLQSCTWGGSAVNSSTVWWEFSVPEDGQLTVSTISGAEGRYDTVVSIYPQSAGCDSLNMGVEIGCDDDTQLFHAKASALVDAGASYLVEVSAWGEANPAGYLDLQVLFAPVTRWQRASPGYYMTRHMVFSDGRYLYAIGGYRSGAQTGKDFKFDSVSGDWVEIEPLTQRYANTDGALVGNFIYIPFGYDDALGAYDNTHYRYSIAEDDWTILTSSGVITPAVAWGAAASTGDGSAYYYTGGRHFDAPTVPLGTVYEYDIQANSWQTLTPMNTARYAHRAAWVDGELCVAGGLGVDALPLADAECLNLSTETWHSIAPLNIARFSFGSAVAGEGDWYVMGGNVGEETTTAKVEFYDSSAGAWTLLDQYSSLNQSREWPVATGLGSNLYVLGGFLKTTDTMVDTLEWLPIYSRGDQAVFLPAVLNGTLGSQPSQTTDYEPNDSIPLAYGPLSPNQVLKSNFFEGVDVEDFYYVTTAAETTLRVTLTDIPSGTDYDLYLYGRDPQEGTWKTLLDFSENYGAADEMINVAGLPAGRYSIRVRNTWNRHLSQSYTLSVTY